MMLNDPVFESLSGLKDTEMNSPNYRAIAIKVGDLLKYSTSVNEVNRFASAHFRFARDAFPNEAITSARAQLVHDWILSLARQSMSNDERNRLLTEFCLELAPDSLRGNVEKILIEGGVSHSVAGKQQMAEFYARSYHPIVVQHCRELFLQRNFFHAVFEACKVYNKLVKQKSQSDKDGHPLMLDVWGWEKGVLKITPCITETDKNVQEGVKFLSAGMMQAVRNPTAHEPALDWPLDEQDCLDLLSFISFLFRKLDKAVFYKP